MPLIYGEGRKKALARLQKEINATSSEERSAHLQNKASNNQDQGQATHLYSGPVFHGPVSGRYVVPGTHVTGGTVNFDFGVGRNVRR